MMVNQGRWRFALAVAGAVAAFGLCLADVAGAQTTLRVGKAGRDAFSFVPAEVGVKVGICGIL